MWFPGHSSNDNVLGSKKKSVLQQQNWSEYRAIGLEPKHKKSWWLMSHQYLPSQWQDHSHRNVQFTTITWYYGKREVFLFSFCPHKNLALESVFRPFLNLQFHYLKVFKERRFGRHTQSCNQFHNSWILVIFVMCIKTLGKCTLNSMKDGFARIRIICPYQVKGDNGYFFQTFTVHPLCIKLELS